MGSAPADVGVSAVLVHLASRWTLVLIAAAVVFLAFLVNRFAPKKRRRIGRVVSIFALYLLAIGISAGLQATGAATWATRIRVLADLLEVFTVINIAGLAIFDLGLPAMKVELVTLTSDLIIGL